MSGPSWSDADLGDRARARQATRVLLRAALRTLGVVALLLLGYALLPIRPGVGAQMVIVVAAAGLVAFGWVFVRQVRRVATSQHPLVAASEALVLIAAVFILSFATLYGALSANDAAAFTEPIGKVAGIYLSVTVLATVGFGDIAATTDVTRLVVVTQMLADLVLIAVTVRILAGTARHADARLRSGTAAGPTD